MKKPTARFASGGGLETLLVLLAVSTLAGSARSLSLNNNGGRRRGNGRHRRHEGHRDGERQTHERKDSIFERWRIGKIATEMAKSKNCRTDRVGHTLRG